MTALRRIALTAALVALASVGVAADNITVFPPPAFPSGVGIGGVTAGSGTDDVVPKFDTSTSPPSLENSLFSSSATVATAATASTFLAAVAGDGTTGFFNVVGTLPTVPTAAVPGVLFTITGAGSASFAQRAFSIGLAPGYTGSSNTTAVNVQNSSAGTAAASQAGNGNRGVFASASATTTGANVGVVGSADGGNNSWGVLGNATTNKNSGINAGVIGYGRNTGTSPIQVGGWFSNSGSGDTLVSTALGADNGDQTTPIFVLRDNGTLIFRIADGADWNVFRTITAAGTTTVQTIDRTEGCVNLAATQASKVVNNALVGVSSIIMTQTATADATCYVKNVVPTSGTITITMVAACTAETRVCFQVHN